MAPLFIRLVMQKIKHWLQDHYQVLLLSALTMAVLGRLLISYDWRIIHDSAIFLFATQQMENFNTIPFLQFHEENTPLTYLMYHGIGKLFGHTTYGWRLFDYLFLSIMALTTYWVVRPLHRRAALLASLAATASYLYISPTQALQREYLILFPMLLAMRLMYADLRHFYLKLFAMGFLIGLMTGVKVEFSVYGAVLFGLYFYINGMSFKAVRCWMSGGIAAFLGFSLPCALSYYYLESNGATKAFLEIFSGYWPLYRDISLAELYFVHPMLYFFHYLRTFTMFGLEAGYWPLITQVIFFSAFYRIYLRKNDRQAKIIDAIMVLMAATLIVPFIPFKFFLHHYFPFMLISSIFFSLMLFSEVPEPSKTIFKFISFFTIMGFGLRLFDIGTSDYFYRQDRIKATDQIVDYLKNTAKVQKGELIQPVGWTDNGVVIPCFEVESKLPTSFIYGYQFYHHTNTPYIKNLRKKFVEELNLNPPRFLLEAPYMTFQLVGTHRDQVNFPEYEQFRDQNYRFVMRAKNYWGGLLLWEKRLP